MRFEDANDLLKPGYLPFESGYQEIGVGKWVVAGLTRMPRQARSVRSTKLRVDFHEPAETFDAARYRRPGRSHNWALRRRVTSCH
jgi:DAPG hydrolase-like protein